MPQDEMSIAINPEDTHNVFGGANDYRLGWGSSGFYVTTDRGHNWYDGITALPDAGLVPGRGAQGSHRRRRRPDRDLRPGRDRLLRADPLRAGERHGRHLREPLDERWVHVDAALRSERGRSLRRQRRPAPARRRRRHVQSRSRRHPERKRSVRRQAVRDGGAAAGRCRSRSASRATHTPTPCPEGHVGPDRIYITWTRFDDVGSRIFESHSDDRARSWSPAQVINGSAAFCVGGAAGCSDNQGSQPLVQPTNGAVYVLFENFDTPDENQYVLVKSFDGGATWSPPLFITPVFDVNFPQSGAAGGRPDCADSWPAERPLGADEQLLPHERTRGIHRRQARRRVRRRPLPGHRRQPQRHAGELERRRARASSRPTAASRGQVRRGSTTTRRRPRPFVTAAVAGGLPARRASTRGTTRSSRGSTSRRAGGCTGRGRTGASTPPRRSASASGQRPRPGRATTCTGSGAAVATSRRRARSRRLPVASASIRTRRSSRSRPAR